MILKTLYHVPPLSSGRPCTYYAASGGTDPSVGPGVEPLGATSYLTVRLSLGSSVGYNLGSPLFVINTLGS